MESDRRERSRPIRRPKIDRLNLTGLDDLTVDALQAHESIEFGRFQDAELVDRDLSGLTLTDCELSNLTIDSVELGGGRIFDSVLAGINAPRLSAARASIRNVRLRGSRVGAFDLFEGKVRSLVVEDSRLGLVNLRGSDVRDVVFRDCRIDELDLSEAAVARMSFENCTVRALEVHRSTLIDVDLRGADIETVRHLDGLRGAVVDSDQVVQFAAHFAAHLGLVVE
ncbi:pentapeptide repeat-containing protein [Gordonia neofelifaecis]|uniref:Pentapeptide repeat-containing protein n=1 Tax=Gordonia neofelifaecis NRRL B-59395 TaxID=644548 RepID=F1YPB7_9ACTN|nr:pentapeptide repeat-containing protein [Gordonia neofelifaecis]EGD53437.1 hypothetical protein SCNU_18858 [Gordonia neofelifaecis NRRL B-59395]